MPLVLPTVTVTASPIAVIETGGSAQNTQSTFTISRTGSTMGGLTVYWSMSGTATLTIDYGLTVSNGSIFISPGQSSTTIGLFTINNANFDCLRFAEMTLTPNAGYTIGTPGMAEVDIIDDDSDRLVVAHHFRREEKGTQLIVLAGLALLPDLPCPSSNGPFGVPVQLQPIPFRGVRIRRWLGSHRAARFVCVDSAPHGEAWGGGLNGVPKSSFCELVISLCAFA